MSDAAAKQDTAETPGVVKTHGKSYRCPDAARRANARPPSAQGSESSRFGRPPSFDHPPSSASRATTPAESLKSCSTCRSLQSVKIPLPDGEPPPLVRRPWQPADDKVPRGLPPVRPSSPTPSSSCSMEKPDPYINSSAVARMAAEYWARERRKQISSKEDPDLIETVLT